MELINMPGWYALCVDACGGWKVFSLLPTKTRTHTDTDAYPAAHPHTAAWWWENKSEDIELEIGSEPAVFRLTEDLRFTFFLLLLLPPKMGNGLSGVTEVIAGVYARTHTYWNVIFRHEYLKPWTIIRIKVCDRRKALKTYKDCYCSFIIKCVSNILSGGRTVFFCSPSLLCSLCSFSARNMATLLAIYIYI